MLLWLALGGCTVGRDFVRPVVEAPRRWWGADDKQDSGGPVTYGGVVDPTWWTSFGDSELSSLVTRLAAQNLDLQSAAERVRQGRAQRRIVESEGLPHLDANGSYARTRDSLTGPISLFQFVPNPPKDFDVWQDSLSASWELDLFGRVRRAVESERANTEAAVEARHGVALMAVSDLAQDYLQLRGTQALEAVTQANLVNAVRNVALVHNRFANGVSTTLDIANAEAQRATIEASLPQLHTQEARLINAIGTLLALQPRALAAELAQPAVRPAIPPTVPAGLPGELARRRPDVREAEARLHAATAQTGVAVASFYPDVRLMGQGGTQSLQFTETFNLHSSFFSIGPTIDLPIFEGGRLRGTLKLRESQQRQAAIDYQSTVLRAWQDADDAITAYQQSRQRREKVSEAVTQDVAALAAARQRYAEGLVDFLNVIGAENGVLQGQSSLADADTQIGVNLVGVYKALGGGWQVADP